MNTSFNAFLAGAILLSLATGCNTGVETTTSVQVSTNDSAASEPESETPFVRNIGPDQAATLLAQNDDVVVLDVRTPEEYNEGHIADAKLLNYRAADFKEKLGAENKDQAYLVHCASGGRSSEVREIMKELGFTKVYHLDGGFNAWEKAEKPVVR